MRLIPIAQRPVVLCPPALRKDALRAMVDRLARLEEEIMLCRHHAKELELPVLVDDLAESLVHVLAASFSAKAAT